LTWFVLLFASAGVLHHSGIKIPFYGFFGHHDSGLRCKEAPLNMLLAMGITAFLCVGIGVFPEPLYGILPYPVEFEPYTASHVVTQLQLLVFALLAFAFLARHERGHRRGLPEADSVTDPWLQWNRGPHPGRVHRRRQARSGPVRRICLFSSWTRRCIRPNMADEQRRSRDSGPAVGVSAVCIPQRFIAQVF
jgi:hypothetical protein